MYTNFVSCRALTCTNTTILLILQEIKKLEGKIDFLAERLDASKPGVNNTSYIYIYAYTLILTYMYMYVCICVYKYVYIYI